MEHDSNVDFERQLDKVGYIGCFCQVFRGLFSFLLVVVVVVVVVAWWPGFGVTAGRYWPEK